MLNRRYRRLMDTLDSRPTVSITYFRPDERKEGGAYLTVTGVVRKLDPAARRITKNGVEVPLKNKEYELLFFLMRHPEQVFSREDLYELIWGLESMGDNITVAVHINRLREKIEDTPADPKLLQTVWGVGYRLHIV